MSEPIDDGGPAFPRRDSDFTTIQTTGLSLRDWFAGQALEKASKGNSKTAQDIAKRAFYIADAMIKARKETK